jgi:hypothetical protein
MASSCWLLRTTDGEGKRNTLAHQLVTQATVTPITNKVCTPWHLVSPSTDIFLVVIYISPGGKGEGLGEIAPDSLALFLPFYLAGF